MESRETVTTPTATDEYLSIAETARRLGLSAKRIRNLMHDGVFRCGDHFYRPNGIAPRFKWSRVVAWIEGRDNQGNGEDAIPMARSAHRQASGDGV